MPKSKKTQEWVSKKISKLKDEGYDNSDQRVAIALNMAREKGLIGPRKKKKGARA